MPEKIEIGLTLQADGYIKTAETVAKRNREMKGSFEAIGSATQTLVHGVDGLETAIETTSKSFDEFGNVVTRVSSDVGRGMEVVSEKVRLVNTAFEEQLAIRKRLASIEKNTKATDASRITRDRTRKGSKLRPGTSDEQKALVRAEEGLLRLETTSVASSDQIVNALQRARSGAITFTSAIGPLEKAALRVADAERAYGTELRKNDIARRAAIKSDAAARVEKRTLAQAQRDLNTGLARRFDPTAKGVSSSEESQFVAAKRAAIGFSTTASKVFELEAAIIRATTGTLTLNTAFEQSDFIALRLVSTGNALGNSFAAAEEKAEAKTKKTNAALAAQKAKIDEITAARGRIRDTAGIVSNRENITEEEFKPFRRAKETFLGNITNKETGAQAEAALEAARKGTLRLADATKKLEFDAIALAKTERNLGQTVRDTTAAEAAQEAEDKKAAAAKEALALATTSLNNKIRETFNIEKQGATGGEQDRFESARKALINLAETGKFTGATLEAVLQQAIDGTLTLGNTTDKATEATVRLVSAGKQLGAQDTRKQATKRQKEIDENKKIVQTLKERAALEKQVQRVKSVSRENVNVGAGSQQEIQGFLRAEKAAIDLAQAGKLTGAEFAKAFSLARRGAIDLTKQLTAAESAAVDLAAAEKQIGVEARATGGFNPFKRFIDGAADLVRVTGIGLFIGNIFRLQGAIEESIADASELARKLAEIDTIQTDNALSTGKWADELRKLSDTFGISTLDQAEAAYQTLSNQVGQGADAIKFLGAANRLAVTGLTDASSAVKLLSSAVNAFRIPVEDADTLSAKFFKTVELGRVRIEELSDTFGRVAVPANQLGVSFDEVNAAIATLSVQGIKADEAVTLLRNIIQKLIRPGEKLKETLAEMGFSSGQAAIATLGFGGVLGELERRVGGNVEQVGELFQRIRAITGVLGFAGDSAAAYASNLDKIANSNVNDFAEDTNKILNSTGQTLKIASEQAKNFFEKSIGTPVVNKIAVFIKSMGGVNKILQSSIDAMVLLGKAAITGVAIGKVLALGTAMKALAASTTIATAAMKIFAVSAGSVATAIGIGVVALTEFIKIASEDNLRELERQAGEVAKAITGANEAAAQQATRQAKAIKQVGLESTRAFNQGIAAQQSVFNEQAKLAAANAKIVKAAYKEINRETIKSIKSVIKEQDKLFKEAEKIAEASAKAIIDTLESIDLGSLNADLDSVAFNTQLRFIEDQIVQARQRANDAVERGDLKSFNAETKRINELAKRKVDASVKASSAELKLRKEEGKLETKILIETNSKRKKSLKQDLKNLRTRINLVREGTNAELLGIKDLQKARKALKDATTSKDRKEAKSALSQVEEQQKRINDRVAEERKLRQGLLNDQLEQVKQLDKILKLNAQRQEQAQKRKAALENSRHLLSLVVEESKTFKEQAVLTGDNVKEINKQVAEQQKRFAEILALQSKLGITGEGQSIIQRRSKGLQERTQIAINKLKLEGERIVFVELSKRLKVEKETLAQGEKKDRNRAQSLTLSLKTLETGLSNITSTIEVTSSDRKSIESNFQRRQVSLREGFGPNVPSKFKSSDTETAFLKRLGAAVQSLITDTTSDSPGLDVFGPDSIDKSKLKFDRALEALPIEETGKRFLELQVAVSKFRQDIIAVTTFKAPSLGAPTAEIEASTRAQEKLTESVVEGNALIIKEVAHFLEAIRTSRSFGLTTERTDQFETQLLGVLRDQRIGFASIKTLADNVGQAQRIADAENTLKNARTASAPRLAAPDLTPLALALKDVTDAPTALKALKDFLTKTEASQGTTLAPGLPNLDTGIKEATTTGGGVFFDAIFGGGTSAAEVIKKAMAEGGTEAGKNQANALIDQTAKRKQQKIDEIAADKAKREAAIAAQEKADNSFVDKFGNFIARGGNDQGIARGGGAGIGRAGSDRFGQFVGFKDPLDGTPQGERIARAVAKQDAINAKLDAFQAEQAKKGPSKGPFAGEFEAQAKLREAREKEQRHLVPSEIAGARERGISARENILETDRDQAIKEANLASEKASTELLSDAGNRWAAATEKHILAMAGHALLLNDAPGSEDEARQAAKSQAAGEEVLDLTVANRKVQEDAERRERFERQLRGEKVTPLATTGVSRVGEAPSINSRLSAIEDKLKLKVAGKAPGVTVDTSLTAEQKVEAFIAALQANTESNLAVAQKMEEVARKQPARTPFQERPFGDGSGSSSGFRDRIFGRKDAKPSAGFQERFFGGGSKSSAGFRDRLGFTPQIRRPTTTAEAQANAVINSNNTNSNNTSVKINIVSPDPKKSGKQVDQEMRRAKRVQGK